VIWAENIFKFYLKLMVKTTFLRHFYALSTPIFTPFLRQKGKK